MLKIILAIAVIAISSGAEANYVSFQAQNVSALPPTIPTPDVVCRSDTGNCIGVGGQTGAFTPGTCDGVADDSDMVNTFKTWAVGTWQASHTGWIELDTAHGTRCMFMRGGNGVMPGRGVKQLILKGAGYTTNGSGATWTDNYPTTSTSSVSAGNSVLHLASVPASIWIGAPVFNFTTPMSLLAPGSGPPTITNISGNDITLSYAVQSPGVGSGDVIAIQGNGFFFGGFDGVCSDAITSPSGCSARFQSSNIGDSCVSLTAASVSGGYIARFTAGNYIAAGGLDQQGFGYPPNPEVFEYAKVASVDAAHACDGVTAGASVHFTTPLTKQYLDTWPFYSSGGADQGGPATIYAYPANWDTSQYIVGLTIDQIGQTYSVGRDIHYLYAAAIGGACLVPTQNQNHQLYNVDMLGCAIEIDKMIDTITYDGVSVRRVDFQSASVGTFNFNNSNASLGINGTPHKFVGQNSTISEFSIGPGQGYTSEVTCTKCNIAVIAPGGSGGQGFPYQQMSGGVIKIPMNQFVNSISNNGSGAVRITLDTSATPTPTAAWLTNQQGIVDNLSGGNCGSAAGLWPLTVINSTQIDLQGSTYSAATPSQCILAAYNDLNMSPSLALFPGANLYWNIGGNGTPAPPVFKVTGMTQDATATYVQTNQVGGFPTTLPGSNTAIGFNTVPTIKFNCTLCTGYAGNIVNGTPANAPFGSYWKATIDKDTVATFNGSINGKVLTVTAMTSAQGTILPGKLITAPGVGNGSIISNGTGTGGVGTYNLDNVLTGTGGYTVNTPPPYLWGTLTSVKFTVNTPYTGAGSPRAGIDDPFVFDPTLTTKTDWNALVDPKLAGSCTFTPTTVIATGSQTCSLTSAPGAIWFFLGQITPKFTSTVGSDPVSVDIEFKTDTGINWLLKRDVNPASNDNDPMFLEKAA